MGERDPSRPRAPLSPSGAENSSPGRSRGHKPLHEQRGPPGHPTSVLDGRVIISPILLMRKLRPGGTVTHG